MNDLISRQEAIRIANGYCHPANIAKELAKLPSVQPERKMGKWIDGLNWDIVIGRYCSECGQRLTSEKTVRMKFCPNCGAKMEEGEQE